MGHTRRNQALVRTATVGGIAALFLVLALVFLHPPARATAHVLTVNNTVDDVTPTICSDSCTLRDAVFTANTTGLVGDTFEIDLPSGVIDLANGVLSVGSSTNLSTLIKGAADGTSEVLQNGSNSVFTTSNDANLATDFQDVKFSGGAAGDGPGGGVDLAGGSGSSATFTHCTFSGNSAANGGAIGNSDSLSPLTVSVVDSTFQSNSALLHGGAISFSNPGALTITGSAFDSNTMGPGGLGGAVYADQTPLASAGLPLPAASSLFQSTITLSSFTNNSANLGEGGAIYDNSGSLGVSLSRFFGNSASGGGSDIFKAGVASVTAEQDWWGSDSGPEGTSGFTPSTWLMIRNIASPTHIDPGATTTVTADLLAVSDDTLLPTGALTGLPPFPASFDGAVNGTISSASADFVDGVATATFTGGVPGPAALRAHADFTGLLVHITVNPYPSTTGVTSSQNPSVFGQGVTFTATVTPSVDQPVTGTVQFGIDGVNQGSPVPLTGAAATLSVSTLPAGGPDTVTATYSGDAVNAPSSGTLTPGQTVNPADTSVAVSSSQNPSVFGQGVTFTATVTTVAPGAGTPTGLLQFDDNGVPLSGLLSLDGSGTATFSTSALTAGNHPITAVYGVVPLTSPPFSGVAGDYHGSTGTLAGGQQVNPAPTSVGIASSTNPSVFGQGVTFTATVTSTVEGTPTGNVQFGIDGLNRGAPVTMTAGAATLANVTNLGAGLHAVTATYSGDTTFATSSGSASQVVNRASTSVAVSSSLNPAIVSQSVQFTATVTVVAPAVGTPTGSIQFMDGASPLGSLQGLSGGVASLSTSSLTVGNHAISAVYSPTLLTSGPFSPPLGNFNASTGSLSGGQQVNLAPTTLSLTASPNPAVFGQGVHFQASVTSTFSGTVAGTVQFGLDGVNLGGPLGIGSGHADITNVLPSVGQHTVTATYSGNGVYDVSAGTLRGGQTVNQDTTTAALATAPNPSDLGQSVVVTATVSGDEPGSGTPTGTVAFFADGNSLGSNGLSGAGSASVSTSGLTSGLHTVTATYEGSDDFVASNAAPVTQTVRFPTTTTVISGLATPVVGQPVTFTATVDSGGNGAPPGTVAFSVSGTFLGDAPLSGGVAVSPAFTTLAVGTDSVVATYLGSTNYTTSASTPLSQNVARDSTTTIVNSSDPTAPFGEPVNFTATVLANLPGGGTPQGLMAFFLNGQPLASAPLVDGSATIGPFTEPLGSYELTAVYPDTASYITSSDSMTQGVVNAGTTTSVASSSNPSVFGQPVTFTATVAVDAPGAGTPTGTVQFSIDGVDRGDPVALASGSATLGGIADLAVGSHTVTATYAGADPFNASTSVALPQVVDQAGTTTGVTSAKPTTVFGEPVTFTASVLPLAPGAGNPTGSVQFFEDGTGFGDPVALDGTTAVSAPFIGFGADSSPHTVTATYSGDGNFTTSSGSTPQTVNPADASVAVSSSLNPSIVGQAVQFTATVTAVPPGAGTPTGSITFEDGATPISDPLPVDGSGVATFSTSALTAGNHPITAVYGFLPPVSRNFDGILPDFNGSTGTLDGGQQVNLATTSVDVESSIDPSVFGQGVSFTATVTSTMEGTPTGTVQFGIDGANVGDPIDLASASATMPPVTGLSVGDHTVTATYTGNAAFGAATGSTIQTVDRAATTTIVTSAPNPSAFTDTVVFTATVTATAPGAGAPSGNVQIVANGQLLGSPSLDGGVATLPVSIAVPGVYDATATYSGDASFATSSATTTQTVSGFPTITTVGSSANPSVAGQPLVFTATVATDGNGVPNDGTVQFSVDGVDRGGPVGVTAGTAASAPVTDLAVGTPHSVTATYVGVTLDAGSTSPPVIQTVNKDTTTTQVTSSANPSAFGQPVTFTATVSANLPGGGTPDGVVQFFVGGQPQVTATLSGGVATTTDNLALGTHPVTVVYMGSSSYITSSRVLAGGQVVAQSKTTTSLSSSASPSVWGQPVSFTATVAPAAPGAGSPGGTATITVDGGVVASGPLVNGGVSTGPLSNLAVRGHTVVASYSGDADFAASTSTVTQVVNPADTTTTVVSAQPETVFGQPVSFTATVVAVAPGAGTPNGQVHVFGDGFNVGTFPLDGAGNATSTAIGTLPAGAHTVTATYLPGCRTCVPGAPTIGTLPAFCSPPVGNQPCGGSNFFPSSGSTTQTVDQATTSATVTPALSPSVFGQPVTFTAEVQAVAPGNGTPTGQVEFFADGSSFGTATVVSGAAVSPPIGSLTAGDHAVTATYGGDAGFTSSEASTTQTVDQAGVTVTPATSPSSSVYGESVTFSATVTALAPGAGTPTGDVQFAAGSTPIGGPVPLVGGVATTTDATLPSGGVTITATYAGDPDFTPGSGTTALVINRADTTTIVSSSLNPAIVGQAVVFTVTVTANAPSGATPTGTVRFTDNGAPFGGPANLVGGVASVTRTALTVGTHAIVAHYATPLPTSGFGQPPGNFNASTGTLVPDQVVTLATTTTTVASAPNPSVVGQGVTLTASVTSTFAGTISGDVQFGVDGVDRAGPQPVSGGSASLGGVDDLAAGTHTVTATYLGDATYATSSAVAATQTVNQAGTVTSLGSAPDPSSFGQPVVFTATVTVTAPGAGTPTGTVAFLDGTTVLGSAGLGGDGVATVTTTALLPGVHTVTATYLGDAGFLPSTSDPVTQPVAQLAATTTVAAAPNPAVFGGSVQVTATVTGAQGTPTGSVQFGVGGVNLGGPVSMTAGVATAVATGLPPGDTPVTATYSGDTIYLAGAGGLTETVVADGTTTGVTSSRDPSTFGEPVLVTATVAPVAPGAVTPTGTVQFSVDGDPLGGPVTLTAGVAATGPLPVLAAGTHGVTATFLGGPEFTTSSAGLSQVVQTAESTTSVSSSQNPSSVGQGVQFTATVAPVAPGAGVPTGTVQFTIDGSDAGGPVALSAGSATSGSITDMAAGHHAVAAIFTPGSTDVATSTGTLPGGQNVGLLSASVGVTSSKNPSIVGDNVVFTATVSPVAPATGTPGGSVQFSIDGAGVGSPVTLSGGVATLSTTSLAAGTHAVAASYGGDASFASASGSLSGGQTVAAPASADLSVSVIGPSHAVVGVEASFGIVVANAGPNDATGVVVSDTLPAGWTVVAAAATQGTCTPGSTVSCAIGNLAAGAHAVVTVVALPHSTGTPNDVATVTGDQGDPNLANNTASMSTQVTTAGYWLFGSDGGVFTFGDAGFFGSTGSMHLNRPVVAMTSTPDGQGYWLFASDGGVFAFGDARFFGSTGSMRLNAPIVAMATTPDGQGYWLFASDGGVFAYGDAGFFGSTGGAHLSAPVVGMAATPTGKGYWLVGSDGTVSAFGDAGPLGNLASQRLAAPIVGMAATPTGKGYWLVGSDGGVFAFGDATLFGTLGGTHLNSAIVGIATTKDGLGYWLAAADGGVFGFGDAPFLGGMGGQRLNKPINGLASSG